ncbi:TIM barrel protein [Flagellimonas olearia]|uniref:mannonate dehydratase n=1 Tax=Flagellimonas olearia TaxID=552546 RepID=A0A6I1E503_9FLAO|nr:mannonate dehydratase [Allomuricauda olearia]KAB7531499.1 TIM barrel protein [Allomuricauda olearia]
MKDFQNLDRRNALATMVKGGLGLSSVGFVTSACGRSGNASDSQNEMAKAEEVDKKPFLMKLGCQHGGTGKQNLEFLARYGVFNMDGGSPKFIEGVGWDLDDSLAKREACEKYGISLDAYHLPLSSAGVDRVRTPNIMLGKNPERDREIEMIQQMITVAAKTGVRILMYNTILLPILRTHDQLDATRGNSYYRSWNYEQAMAKNEGLTSAGRVDVDEMFERITYFLDRVLPVADEYGIKLANHIADPPTSVNYRGITRWNSPDVFKGIQRFAELYDSPNHGFNLCLGTTAEGLKDPKTEILPIIKWVGERNQIFNIHLRNIKGGFNDFEEVYPDNGDMDFFEIIKALRDVGYNEMVMPDHVPHHEDPASGLQSHAYAFGYIKALMQIVERS